MRDGWKIQTLADACSFERGLTYSKSDEVVHSGNAVLRANNIDLLRNKLDLREIRYISDSVKIPPGKKIKTGCLIICTASGSKSHLGKVAIIEGNYDYAFGGFMGQITPKPHINPKYLFYVMTSPSYKSFVEGLSNGMNINNLKFGDLQSFSFVVPPLIEQLRIVAILDEAFEGIAAAVANAEKNFANAGELFGAYLLSIFRQRGAGWIDVKLESVCGIQNGFAFKSELFKPNGTPILRISNIQNGKIELNRLVFCDPKDYRENLDRYRITKGDLLIAMSGATTGKLGFNETETVFYLNQRVGKFEPREELDKQFLYYYLSTKIEENLGISAGAAQPNLSTEQIRGFLIPIPPIESQRRIVQELEDLSDKTDRLKSAYLKKLDTLSELKQRVLEKAFSGELTAQPEKALQKAIA